MLMSIGAYNLLSLAYAVINVVVFIAQQHYLTPNSVIFGGPYVNYFINFWRLYKEFQKLLFANHCILLRRLGLLASWRLF